MITAIEKFTAPLSAECRLHYGQSQGLRGNCQDALYWGSFEFIYLCIVCKLTEAFLTDASQMFSIVHIGPTAKW